MIRHLLLIVVLIGLALDASAAEPLRVFIRAGVKTHGPGQHDHPRFLSEYTKLLNDRGIKTQGAMTFPTEAQLAETDVLVMYAAEGGTVSPAERSYFEKYLKRGGGIVVLHDAVCGTDPHWFKTIVGGAWEHKHSKWLEGEVGIYFLDQEHPITRGISNFDLKDEIYYDLHMQPEAKILATSFHSVFIVAPQMWVYEKDNYRAFVCLQGHEYTTFDLPHFRTILLRGIAWAAKRPNPDEFCKPEELASLTYPVGGPTAPEKAHLLLNVHPEFNLNLVAAEPLIEKVISLDWDAKGRMWVAETPEYPNGRTLNQNDRIIARWSAKETEPIQPGQKEDRPARDRISWLEDTDGDGRMDRKHVFADGLELVTSLVFYREGVIVAQAPDIWWLRDTNGDGKCDMQQEKVLLYTGFGTFDTHAVINNFRWGMDGWVYGAIGYSAGTPVSGDGAKNFGRVTAGVIRFRPNGSALEQVVSGSCNTWGFDFAPDGEAFYTTATCGEHFLHVVMPEKALARGSVGGRLRGSQVVPDHQNIAPAVHHTRPAYVQIDWVGQFTAAAGCCIYQGGAWPERWEGSHFCSETTMSLVHNEFLKPSGVSYVASKETGREQTEFIAGSDLWFRPIHERVGPDGALYIVDFYNQAAIHNDTRGPKHGARNAAVRPDRDHHFGRIWRVQHKSARVNRAPVLDRAQPAQLVKALEHPNGWVRQTAQRLLAETTPASGSLSALNKLARNEQAPVFARIHALWTTENLGAVEPQTVDRLIADSRPVVRRNALRVLAETRAQAGTQPTAKSAGNLKAVLTRIRDEDPRTRLQALLTLGTYPPSAEIAAAVIAVFPDLKQPHLESAALAVANQDPMLTLKTALASSDANRLSGLVTNVAKQIGLSQDPKMASALAILVGEQGAQVPALARQALESLAETLKPDVTVSWTPDLESALKKLLAASSSDLGGAALPLVARWDDQHKLAAATGPIIDDLSRKLVDNSLTDQQRVQIAVNLLGVRRLNNDIVSRVAGVLNANSSPQLQRGIIEALGNTPDPAAGEKLVAAFGQAPPELREAVFSQLIKRADWAMALIDGVKRRQIDLVALGPASIHRLRTHPDKTVSARAIAAVEEIRGPELKQKDELIAQFASSVGKRGDTQNGKTLFTQNCATCHKFKGEGRDVAPDLTGMGAHGPLDLLVHVLDPNRVVEPNFVTTSIETQDDQSYDGVVARENSSTILLRNATGDFEIRQDNIRRRRSTGLSLMPNGFETLGQEGLRDLISYLVADENRYRVLDLTPAFTANSTRGIYANQNDASELRFVRFGLVKAGEVPFEIVPSAKSPSGNNVIVLKGGQGFAKTLPQKVEIKPGVAASQLHFLGGVSGWGWPCCGEQKNENLPVAKATVHYANQQAEEFIFKNGQEFADYNGKFDVPGSKEAVELVRYGQVRWFSRPLKQRAMIDRIVLESFDNAVAPTFVAITAELADTGSPAASSPAVVAPATATPAAADAKTAAEPRSKPLLTLIVGGGSSHDFGRWFNQADSATLQQTGRAMVSYTEDPATIPALLKRIQVLYLSNNQPLTNAELRQGIFDFAQAGNGLLLVHPALWYNWSDWPQYNQVLVGGGARSHDKYGEFEVTLDETNAKHPILAGVPKSFSLKDELYQFVKDAHGSEIQVLATGKSPVTGKTFPVLWVTKHAKARIVCLTLGHDGAAHENPAFQQILKNAVLWAGHLDDSKDQGK